VDELQSNEIYEAMTLEEMKSKSWVVSWSGGKDSTATILLMREHGVPIKEIIYVRMMFDDELAATLPIMTDFVDRAAETFRGWGYKTTEVRAIRSAMDLANDIYFKSKHEYKNGKPYGMTAFCRRACRLQQIKQKTIENQIKIENEYQMIGYAADEPERLHRLGDKKQSIMAVLGVTELDAMRICEAAGLLSPLYHAGIGRDGCFFCPNAAKRERERLRHNHPELIEKIYGLIEMQGYSCENLAARNNWIKEYYAEKAEKESGYRQLSIFDVLLNISN